MKKLRLFLLAFASLLIAGSGFSQEIVNIKAKQFDTNLNITYDIIGEQVGQLFDVSASYSIDGKSFKALKSTKGSIGKGVPGGVNNVIIWEVLKDVEDLKGNLILKIDAVTETKTPDYDEDQKFFYQIKSLHYENNKLWAVFNIKNKGDKRDLKVINGKVTVTDFNGKKYDSFYTKLGSVTGPDRISQPQINLKPGEEIEARFRFDWAPTGIERIKDFSITFEALKIDYGIDYKKGIVKFRDLPVTQKEQKITGNLSKKSISGKSNVLGVNIEEIKLVEKEKDLNPPIIQIDSPKGVLLINGKSVDSRGVPMTHNVNNLEDNRTRAVPITHNVNNMEDGRTRAVPITHNVNNMDDGRTRAVPVTHNVNNMEDDRQRDLISFTEDQITIEGKVIDESGIYEVIVNGRDAMLLNDSMFKCKLILTDGTNLITIRAMDIHQNVSETSFKVFKKKTEQQTVPSNSADTEDLDLIISPKVKVGKYFALIIAVNEYPDEKINDLNEPVNDATKLGQTLIQDYEFAEENVYFLKNPTRGKIIDAFDYLNKKLTDKDNLLIFYAGHGHWDFETELGFWLPSDAFHSSSANWLRNSTIRDFIGAFKTKHTLLIADACFSGGIFKTRKAFRDASSSINKLYEVPSRKAMTSGNLKEVPDKSVFLEQMVSRLKSNTRKYLSAEELFSSFKVAVMNNSPNTPQFGDIKGCGDEGGDFIFIRKNGTTD